MLAWPLTISMLALAGLPATAGFIGKLYLIEAAVEGDYTWLGGVHRDRDDDLARLLPARGRGDLDAAGGRAERAGGAGAGDRRRLAGGRRRAEPPAPARCLVILGARPLLAAAATVFFGVIPSPLVDWAAQPATSIGALLLTPPSLAGPAAGRIVRGDRHQALPV